MMKGRCLRGLSQARAFASRFAALLPLETVPGPARGRFPISDREAELVEDSGIEPLTYWLQTSRSPS